ncbi:MAG: DUF1592 domain-containing protein [bacterium]|nr:DUF1592 domain-containing protein [bacterium]
MERNVSRSLLLGALLCVAECAFADGPVADLTDKALVTAPASGDEAAQPTLGELRATGLARSRFKDADTNHVATQGNAGIAEAELRQATLAEFDSTIRPLLERTCFDCHGPGLAEGNLRLDLLDPDLVDGADTDWWVEVYSVVTNGEMPPENDGLADDQRRLLVDWLSKELQTASAVHRRSGTHTAFRRLTRYEFNYALQDLIGLPWDFAKDLPPEAHSEDGFENSSELLQLSGSQFETYHRLARSGLQRAIVTGERPTTRYWNVSMKQAADREWAEQDKQVEKIEQEFRDQPEELKKRLEQLAESSRTPPRGAYYKQLTSGRIAKAEWNYPGARYAFAPQDQPLSFPEDYDCVAILPDGRGSRLIIELGNQLPDEGMMRVTVRASRVDVDQGGIPSLQLMFGWQASNEGRALVRVSKEDTPVTAGPDEPQLIEWNIPLGEIYPRNSVRKTSPMGGMPSPSEYIRLVNSSASKSAVQIDFIQVAAPVYDHWPPQSHVRLLGDGGTQKDERERAADAIAALMTRAWRRPIRPAEVDRKLELFDTMRPLCDSFEEAMVDVLATVLSAPQFLYVGHTLDREANAHSSHQPSLAAYELASRLSLFLWCSVPDQELLALAESGQLLQDDELARQVQRMLEDSRSQRFVEHFVRQWLNLELLEFQDFSQKIPGFDPLLQEAMYQEPIALFAKMLRDNASVLDFIHGDYAMLNERLARHYGISGVDGNHFRPVSLDDGLRRGGLLTQAGVLAMNSDYPDSHPLKRAIWLLESVLADPPPPPPPAVPQIDLANPEIAKMTLKERIEDHRNHAACMSCHIKIDPWGIAFENYGPLGEWREEIQGKQVDASSQLFNGKTLDGMPGLKGFLLLDRQDQFVRAVVSKLSTYALGRPLSFADRAEIDAITSRVRQSGDGLGTLVRSIIQSELFRSPDPIISN